MKIAVTSSGPNLDSETDPRFGRAQYLLIVDTETLDLEPIQNPSVAVGGGAGIQTSQIVVSSGAEAVLTGDCGPNAYRTLQAADVRVYAGLRGSVREALLAFTEGDLRPLAGPSVPGHSGIAKGGPGRSA